ncbi:erythrocyte membrane protein 1 [Plasmodium falciparum RAJ116]|uniref:Erythrocyte membrane protein 1 n=4 Tax=Plasmodium falciparum TaxID=5833 RepID=A0A0L0CVW6_PLAFA|nr:erythrocyte membrane protein 1 [Plasmodium falciparum RAJ116]
MALPGSVGEDKYKSAPDAKHLLDEIGEVVYKQVKKEADGTNYINELKGSLASATTNWELGGTDKPCMFDYTTRLGANSERHPCGTGKDAKNEDVKRFSDTQGAECTKSKIKYSDYYRGACAPFRRLNLCNKNMEKMDANNYDSGNAKHKLLAEVCYAAQQEGKSITGRYPQHQQTNEGTSSQLCTVLARSFADIGDIIRGKDLYLGDKGNDKLEDNLKKFFGKIHNGLDGEAKKHYENDTANYYQLREDWWTANRETVWKAITCSADRVNAYFRKTCNEDGTSSCAIHQCRCQKKDGRHDSDQVPTYFDYVPQFLRWFEEWAEDFCRKRKKKLTDAINKCRTPNGENKYCDLNRHDCEQTIRGDHVFFEESDCNDCSVACKPFVKWIDKQKVEFDKQKKKYTSEITGDSGRRRRRKKRSSSSSSSDDNGYEKKFYNILKGGYNNVDKFLEKLNDEAICKSELKVGHETADAADFTEKKMLKTFSHTEYCQACPWCGAEPKSDGGWKAKDDKICGEGKKYADYKKTEIPILTADKKQLDILQKYSKFCNSVNGKNGVTSGAPATPPAAKGGEKGKNGDNITETWTCYYKKKNEKDDVKGDSDDINFCVQQKQDNDEKKEYSMHYNAFFWDWVYHMLHDSLDWRNELGSCINNNTNGNRCKKKNKCKDNCGCFLQWVNRKRTEWTTIKDHFKMQSGFDSEGDNSSHSGLNLHMTHDVVLEGVLDKDVLFKSIEDTHVDAKDIERIGKMLQQAGVVAGGAVGSGGEDNTTIDKFLQEEERFAKDCLEKHNEDQCKPKTNEGAGRSLTPVKHEEHDSDDEVEAEEAVEHHEDGDTTEGPKEVVEETVAAPEVKPCDIVAELFKDTSNFSDACTLKYGPKAPTSWKCVSSGNTSEPTGKSGGDKDGAICIPPRRRKLYIGGLTKWATTAVSSEPTSATASRAQSHPLLTAFVESAAVETFFLWHRYKKENTKTQSESPLLQTTVNGGTLGDSDEQTPEKLLQKGHIPPDFLRLMFYTLGDYRDILFGKNDIVIGKTGSGASDKEMKEKEEKIKGAIQTFFQQTGDTTPVKTSVTTPQTWWKANGEHIWNGMVCALTYKENGIDKPEVDTAVRAQLWDDNTKKPKEDKYHYEKVTLENSETEARTNDTNNQPTKLSDFVKIPTYFRYLEEWGQNFCTERTKRLEKIKEECKVDDDDNKCSGDGHVCEKTQLKHNDMSADLNCPSCYEQCRKYKKWIDKKFEEFHKQKDKYKGEHGKLKANHNGDNNCCKEIHNRSTAADFFKALKHCKDDEAGEVKKSTNKDNKINFNDPKTTFGPLDYCKTCPSNKVTCNGAGRGKSGKDPCTEVNGKVKSWQSVFNGNGENSTDITVEMIDRRGPFIEEYMEKKSDKSFKDSYLFKSVRDQQWECRFNKTENKDVCKLKNFNDKIDLNEYTTFKVLLHYWLEDFLYGYYISKKRKIVEKCTQKGEKACSDDEESQKNCVCVKTWVEKKESEWKIIKKYYNDNLKTDGEPIYSRINSFFEQGLFDSAIKKDKGNVTKLSDLEKSVGCNFAGRAENSKEDEKEDVVLCLLEKLKDKIQFCQNQPHEQTPPKTCENPPHSDETLDLPEEDTLDHAQQSPKFCPPPPVPETPLTCVERAAQKVRIEAEENAKKYDSTLIGVGKNFNGECNKLKKEKVSSADDSCNLDKTYKNSLIKITNSCKDNGKERFEIGQKWKTKYIRKIRKHLYIPPRREHMCINHLKEINRYIDKDSNSLLKKIQQSAKNEGDDIIKNLLPENTCNENLICDAMKYSFADLGDIIRGRDLLKNYGDQLRIQKPIEYAFENIYNKLDKNNQNQYKYDFPFYYKLRSDWWDANRKAIWNAMTCNAPKDAKLNKRNEEPEGTSTNGSFVSTLDNCGYEKDPPDYDYIYQPFRWMQEWSESFCKLLNEEIKNFQKECKDCKNNNITCEGDENGEKCEKCRKQCDKYTQAVHQWEKQFGKYKEIYNYLYNNDINTDNKYTNEYFKNFVKKLKHECNGKDSADKYLDETSHCKKYKFTNHSGSNNNNDNYAFKNPPKEYETACECELPDPLDKCPNTEENKGACEKLSIENACKNKDFNNDDDSWTSVDVKDSKGKNHGVLVPPRRRHLCLRNITSNTKSINNKKIFKNELLKSAYSEGYYLWDKYKHDSTTLLDVMRYSFYDYGDIVKGTDMLDTTSSRQINKRLTELLNASKNGPANVGSWWRKNKTHVWHAMLCGYQARNDYKSINASRCTVPSEDNNSYQFLRWFREWTESFCIQRKKLYDIMVRKCEEAECDKNTGKVNLSECTQACRKYENYILQKKQEYFGQKKKYDKDFKTLKENKDAPDYFRTTFFSTNYDCLYNNFNDNAKWDNPYESLGDNTLKDKCQCKKTKSKPVPVPIPSDKEETPPVRPPAPDIRPAPPSLPPADEPFDPTILQTTIPFGVALALGSIAFLFLKKKTQAPVDLFSVINIPKSDYGTPTPKSSNRYIPYVSDTYKGKTYIYMEGDTSGDEDKYIGDITSSDITSSESEYEEIDINDIYVPGSPKYKTLIEVVLEPSKRDTQNDIPSGDINSDIPNTPSDTQNDIQSDDIPSDTPNTLSDIPNTPSDTPPPITDDEWNQLKHDFISNMLQNTQNTEPNILGDNVDNNTNPKTLHVSMEEKPFIMSIHDRNLYTGEEYSYDMSTNSGNNDLYNDNHDSHSGTKDPYSGTDLINDALSGNKHIDIYDELLKRKENELFGTNHTKHTTTNIVAKLTNSDPIHNQLELFHKWLDRHRYMCEKWSKKEELLDKLKEEWNNENNTNSSLTHTSNIPSGENSIKNVLNTDVSIQIDMDNPKTKNEFKNIDTTPNKSTMDTILEDLDKTYNEPYYDVQDDIYYDVNDDKTSVDHINMDYNKMDSNNMDVPSKVKIEMNIVNNKKDIFEEEYPMSDIWNI